MKCFTTVCRCECISEARAKDIHKQESKTKWTIGVVLLALSVPAMAYLVIRHRRVVEKYSCVGEESSIDNFCVRICLYFLHFWIWPLAMSIGGVVLLALSYGVDDTFYDGCCGNGYGSCAP